MSRGILLAAVALCAACSGITVRSDYVPGTEFQQYQTWDWIEGQDQRIAENQITDRRLRDAITASLENHGLTRAASGDPDIYVGYQLTLDDQTDIRTVNDYWGPGWSYGPYWGPTTSRTETIRYTVGTLILDFFDATTRELVWRGVAEGNTNDSATPEQRQARAEQVVGMILERYPPEG